MKKIYTLAIALFTVIVTNAQQIIYSNNFESGVGAATIIGNGVIEDNATANFGKVFHNAATGQAARTNYLLLSDTIFTALQHSKTYRLSVSFWVNKGTATDYYWTPIFSAYGAAPVGAVNTWPMMVLESRFWVQINCAGWCDFTNADNVSGTNTESTTWLDDSNWHLYTATLDTNKVKVFIDGSLKNAWNLNGTDGHTIKGLFSSGSSLKYICLGGNQAWNWNDPDPAYLFDDVAIYSDTLSVSQMQAIISTKTNVTRINSVTSSNIKITTNELAKTITIYGFEGNARVMVMSLDGKVVKQTSLNNNGAIDISNASSGAYVVKVVSKNGTATQKLIVK